MDMKNNLAVILLNYKDAETVINYAKIIEKYPYIDRIIVVDNQSPDDSFLRLKTLKSKKIDVIQTPENKGYASGNNLGIRYLVKKYGDFKYIAVSNSDVEVSESTFKKCVTFLEKNKDVAIVAPRMYDKDKKPTNYCIWKYRTLFGDLVYNSEFLLQLLIKNEFQRYSDDYIDGSDYVYVDCLMGAFFLVKGDVFKQVDYFDENTFLYVEEDILSKKVRALGYKTVMLNTCHYVHYESVTINKSLKQKQKNKHVYKSLRYYHLNYDEKCNKPHNKWKIFFLDLVVWLKPIDGFFCTILYIFRYIFKLLTYVWKIIVLLLSLICYPFIMLYMKSKKTKKILYISDIPYNFDNPNEEITKYLNKKNCKIKAISCFKYPDMMNNALNYIKDHKINNFKIKQYNYALRPRWYMILKTSFWIYDEIILSSIRHNYFFFMTVHRMRKTKIIFEKLK